MTKTPSRLLLVILENANSDGKQLLHGIENTTKSNGFYYTRKNLDVIFGTFLLLELRDIDDY